MQELDLASNILEDIVENDTPFSESLRKVFQADPNLRPLRSTVAGLVGCELRHHLLFGYLTEPLKDLTPGEKRLLALCLGDVYFFKRLPADDIKKALQEKLGDAKMALAQPLLDKASDPENFIPAELPKSSNRYLSLRYNTPEWVLKIWQHFGYGATYKILKKNNRPLVSSVRLRAPLTVDEMLNKSPEYAKTSIDMMLFYGGKEPLRKIQEFRDNKMFVEKLATKMLIDKFKIAEPKECFCYNGNADPSILEELVENYGTSIGLNLGVHDVNKYVEVTRLIKEKGLKNVNFFQAEPDSLEAAISRPQDLVIAAPDSSNFDLIREYPDYLLHFKKEAMDALFAQEKATLEGVSKYVEEGGLLLYVIYTISKKEGRQTIEEFLHQHPEFQLVEDKQLFPYEDLDTALYYAALKKDSKLVKAGVPLGNLAAVAPVVSAPSAAAPSEPVAAKNL
jgi:16S rRNA (cytosine967-C5)-methyltransferase